MLLVAETSVPLILQGATSIANTYCQRTELSCWRCVSCSMKTCLLVLIKQSKVCVHFVADKKKLQYIKMKYQFNMVFEGLSAALWSFNAVGSEINCVYKVTAWSFGVGSSPFGSLITSGFRSSVLKSWHSSATTSWKPGKSCLLAMRCQPLPVLSHTLITRCKQAWTSKLWLKEVFVCCGFNFFFFFVKPKYLAFLM